MSFRDRLFSGAAIGAILVAAQSATAQVPPQLNSQINQLQQQIQQLQQQLQDLQTQVNTQAQQLKQAPAQQAAAPAPGPHITQSSGNRFGLESADGQYSIALTGRLHLDAGDYLSYHADSKSATGAAPGLGVSDLNSGVNARRARLGVIGKFAGDWNYSFIYDFGGSCDGFAAAAGTNCGTAGGASGLENAFVTYNGLYKGPRPIAFDLGYMDTPFTLDEATSSNDIMFMERSSSQVVATAFGAGDNRSALGIRSNDDRYWAGIYATGPTSGSSHSTGEQFSAFGRFTYQALAGSDYSLHLGIDAAGLLHPAGPIRTLTLSDRPELRIDPTTLLSTGSIGTLGTAAVPNAHPVTGGTAIGVETAGGYRSLFFQGEAFNYRVSRAGVPDNNFWGGYLEGSWTLTGEHRQYIPASGAYSGIIPDHPFSLSAGTWGALEVAARVSEVDLNDNFNPTASAATSNVVEGGRQTIYALGINWYLNPNMRFMVNYLHGVLDKSPAAGTGELGANFDAVAMRTQIAF